MTSVEEQQAITAKVELPLKEMAYEFENFKKLHEHTTVATAYMKPLADAAIMAATNFTDYVVQQYERVAVAYIKFKIFRQMKVY